MPVVIRNDFLKVLEFTAVGSTCMCMHVIL